MTFAIAALVASFVAKRALDARKGALVCCVAFFFVGLAFGDAVIPLVLACAIGFLPFWGAFTLLERSSLLLLPVAVVSVLAATGMVVLLQGGMSSLLEARSEPTRE